MSFHPVDGQRITVVQMPNFQLVLQEETDGQETANEEKRTGWCAAHSPPGRGRKY